MGTSREGKEMDRKQIRADLRDVARNSCLSMSLHISKQNITVGLAVSVMNPKRCRRNGMEFHYTVPQDVSLPHGSYLQRHSGRRFSQSHVFAPLDWMPVNIGGIFFFIKLCIMTKAHRDNTTRTVYKFGSVCLGSCVVRWFVKLTSILNCNRKFSCKARIL